MQRPYTALKLAIIDSSDTWYAQPRQIYDELCQMGIDCLWMARPNHEGFRKNRVPAGYTTVCIANNLGPIDFNTRQPLTLSHPPLERAHRSGADFVFIGDKTTFKRYFSSRSNAFYMPYAVNTGIYRPLESIEEIYDLGFVGNIKLDERARRIGLLQKYFQCFTGNNLFMDKANEAMNRCKIIFNTSDHREINMRVFESLAAGKLLITDRVDYLEELFKDGVHLVTYDDEEEMVEKISYYLKHEDERREIARRGLEAVRRAHTYRHRACFIAEKVIQERFTASQVVRDHARSTRSYRMFYEEQSKINTLAQERIFDFSIPDPEGDPTKYNIRERLKEALLVARGRVLDVGCQRGGYCYNLQKDGHDVVGIDISLNYLMTARAKLPVTPLVQADAQYLPFTNDSFDTVLLSEILEHVIDDARVVAEVKRVLRKDGLAFVTVPAYVEDSEEHVRFLSRGRLAVLFEDFNIEFVENPRVKSTLMIARQKDTPASSESASMKLADPAGKPSSAALKKSGKISSGESRSILLATNHLFTFTGSEITLYTIAKFLKEKGHDVSVFAKYVDPGFACIFNGIAPVFTDLRQVQGRYYEAAYVQHHTAALEMRHHFPNLPIVLASLGVLPFLEQPPIVDLNISRYLAISEEVNANLMRKGIREDSITIFRNIVDSRKFRPSRKISKTPRTAVIYSYRIDKSTVATIQQTCEIVGIQCRRIGEKPGVLHQDDVASQINEADIVFTLGRGAIETMMCGKIPIIYDYLGGDGMVTPENIQELMRCNFSGRLHGASYTVQQLIEEINNYKPENGPELRRLAIEHFDASRGVDTLAIILNKAISDFSKSAAGREGEKIKDLVEIITTTKNYTIEAVIRTAAHRRNKNRVSPHAGMPTGVGAGKPDRDTPHRQDIAKSDIGRLRLVSIVIPAFNKVDFTRKCLDALSRNTPRGLYECIIVDNASTDGTGEYLTDLKDEIRVITNSANLGFAKACNQGANAATAPYILFLNNDTEPQPNWLEPLVEVLDRDTSAAAVGSKLLFSDGTIQHAGVLILDDRKLPDPLMAGHIYQNKPSDFREANEPRTFQALTAACLLIRRGAFEEVGGFDEGYWNGYEDIDLCFKFQEKGWVLVYQPESVLIHHESKSGPERFTKVRENIKRLHNKWLGRITPDAIIEKDGSFQWNKAKRIQTYKTPAEKVLEEHREGQRDLVSIVILTFNELDYTKKCVESIMKNTPEPHEIIFVDNGSEDGTVKWLRRLVEENSNYKLIENMENLGFARGCNQGIEASKGEYILLLNNDVLVTENWLPGMLEHLKNSHDIGIVGPMTNNISGVQKVDGTIYNALDDLEAYVREFRNRNRHRRVALRRLVGFCMLFRRSLVNEIGSLDERFGTGNFEDDDFCLRAALKGYRNVIAGDVFIHHYGSRSFIGNRINYGTSLTGNRKIFDDKWRIIQLDKGQGRRCLALKNVEEARKQFHLGRLNRAVDLYLEAIKFVSSETRFYHELAETLIQTRNFKEALNVLREIAPEGRSEKTWILTGFAQEGLNEDDEASALADRTLEHPETRAEALNLKGVLAYKKENLKEAASLFTQAIEVDPSYGEAHTNLGVVRWKEDPGEDALRLLEKGFVLSPHVTDVANFYHSAIKSLNQLERAEAIFREARGLYPLNRTISFLLIDLLMSLEKFGEVMEEIERAMALFEIDDGFLKAALDVRSKVGLLEPTKKTKAGTISLCMIVKNEERNLVRCLSTMKPAVDEIIIVDTGSTDKTKDIATAFGAKVFDIPWQDDFSEARNFSLSKASCDWILVLDADEIIAQCDFVKMRNLTSHVKGGKGQPTGFTLTTRNYSAAMNAQGWIPNDGSYANEEAGPGWFPSRKVRLFRNDPRIRFKGSVHELVEDAMMRHKLKFQSSDIPVHHYGILPAKDGVDKREAYYQLGKKKIDESGGNARAIYELAIQAARLRRYDEAKDLWKRFFDSGFKGDLHLAYMNLGHVYLETGRYEEAAKACKKALEIDPRLKEAHLNLAMSEFYMGRPEEASVILDNLIQKIPDYIPARALLAAALILIGETNRCKATVDYMRKKSMNPAVFFRAYAKKLISAGREEDSARLLRAAGSIWRNLLKPRLKSRGVEATDEEINRVMVLDGKESPPQGSDPEDIAADLERQKIERMQRAPSPRPE